MQKEMNLTSIKGVKKLKTEPKEKVLLSKNGKQHKDKLLAKLNVVLTYAHKKPEQLVHEVNELMEKYHYSDETAANVLYMKYCKHAKN